MRMSGVPAVLFALAALSSGCSRTAPPPATVVVPAPAVPSESVDNPQYHSWAKQRPGTVVVIRAVTRSDGNDAQTVSTTTYTLLEVTPTAVRLRSQQAMKRYDGHETNDPPDEYAVSRTVSVPKSAAKDQPAAAVTESVTVGGKVYLARTQKGTASNEAGEVLNQVWLSDDAPGGLVKAVTRTPSIGKTTTTELISVTVP